MEDILDRYDKLNKIFNDENSDVKKAEQSLFLIETNLNNIQKREKQIGERFFEYKDRFLQAPNIDALKTLIANFEHSSKYERIAKANFEENSIGSNILLFSNIESLLKEVELLEGKIKFKEALILQMSQIAKSLQDIEKSSSRMHRNRSADDIKIETLLINNAGLNELHNQMDTLNKFLQNLDLANHPTVQTLVNKAKEWDLLYHENLEAYLNKLLKVENKRVSINKKELMTFISKKDFFSDASSKTIESLSSLISQINKSLTEFLTSESSLAERNDETSISLLKEDLFYDSGLENDQLDFEKLNHLYNNFKTIMNTHRTLFGAIIKSAPIASLRSCIDKLSDQFEKDIIKKFTDTLFPLIKTQKDEILAKVPEMEAEFGIDSKLLKETIQNYQVIEMLKESDRKLIEWKDDFFLKIQSIQAGSDPRNNENFYRQIINVIKDLSGYLGLYQEITEKDLEKKFLNFEATTLKLIILVLKIVDEKKIPKSQQILNLKSSSFVVIQDLIFSLLSLIQEKNSEEGYTKDLQKILKYFNNQEIDTWIDLKNSSM